ncbi:MAG: tRNA1(Val) (adenine(37)-N6)-methyltransferase [Mogibacterium sp.]|nr:tRNA1(Val) (adenine(37)-N6)-methyltransferase [Mogibacterium sp.]
MEPERRRERPAERFAAGDRVDEAGFGGLRVVQGEGFRYGVDAVLLAAFAAGETGVGGSREDARIADLGTGSGIVSFILAHKLPQAVITGIEVQEASYRRACLGVELNGLEDRVEMVLGDILEPGLPEAAFDAVVTNPPYFRRGASIVSTESAKGIARHETTATLADFLQCAFRLLKPDGSLYMVHRPSRLTDILTGMRAAGLEPKELQMVVPRAGEPANIVLVRGIKGAGPELRLLPEIAVHGEGQTYTPLIEEIYERV